MLSRTAKLPMYRPARVPSGIVTETVTLARSPLGRTRGRLVTMTFCAGIASAGLATLMRFVRRVMNRLLYVQFRNGNRVRCALAESWFTRTNEASCPVVVFVPAPGG